MEFNSKDPNGALWYLTLAHSKSAMGRETMSPGTDYNPCLPQQIEGS